MKVEPLKCGWCLKPIVLGQAAQKITLDDGTILPVVHVWKCKGEIIDKSKADRH